MEEVEHRICRTCFFAVRPQSGLDIPWNQPGICCWCNLLSARTVKWFLSHGDAKRLTPQCEGIHLGDVSAPEESGRR